MRLNAPTVDITEEQAIDKLHETGWMQRHDKEMTDYIAGYEVGYFEGMEFQKKQRPQGKWIPQTAYDGFTYWKCSECGKKNDYAITKFCWHCGADMRKERKDEI